ncbi:glutathione peroxidase [uncultured Abyssibacter sp.]|uniref:glutathione peroxidase n=1 Tax=uncultured Abyssibacter sp. TaxID=2320202 RepID=UPI0032B18232
MKHWMMTGLVAAAMAFGPAAGASCDGPLDVTKRRLAGDESVRLCEAYADQVVLVVNTASKCGYTPQYDGLEALYDRYRDRGFVVLGFPSNDFGGQEPGSEAAVARFCRLTYGVRFPMFEKTSTAEGTQDALYTALAAAGGGYPQWNFHKYLLGRDGRVIHAFPSATQPSDPDLVDAIETALRP